MYNIFSVFREKERNKSMLTQHSVGVVYSKKDIA